MIPWLCTEGFLALFIKGWVYPYLNEEQFLTDDDRPQIPVFLEWLPSPIHSHHPCDLGLLCLLQFSTAQLQFQAEEIQEDFLQQKTLQIQLILINIDIQN